MKKNVSHWFDDRRFMVIFSVIMAVFVWFVVVTTIVREIDRNLSYVPIDFKKQETTLNKLGLNIIQKSTETAQVTIIGNVDTVGNLNSSDINLTVDVSSVKGPGTYDLPIISYTPLTKNYEIDQISPKTVKVKLDSLVSKQFEIIPEISGLQIPDGFIKTSEIVTPTVVNITGSAADIAKIDKCKVAVTLDKNIDRTTSIVKPIELYDKDGVKLDSSLYIMKESNASITIPLLKKKILPVKVDFLNTPPGFDKSVLKYKLSNSKIEVAGPNDAIDAMTEINLGYIDLNALDIDAVYSFPIALPTGFININNTSNVSVEFDTAGFSTKTFNISDINLINKPVNFNVSAITQKIYGVKVICPKAVIDKLSASDLVAELDLSQTDLTVGQLKLPVDVYAPQKNQVWSIGDYSVIISVKSK